jgi:hypothetical protein
MITFTVPELGRTNLFFWTQDWTGVMENGNTTPDWWFYYYFGTVDLSDANQDANGNSLLSDYTNNVIPATFSFSGVQVTNNYVNATPTTAQLEVTGYPYYVAVLVDDTNFNDAVWNTYTSPNVAVSLWPQGWHDIWFGLRGHADAASAAVWQWKRLKLDYTPPQLAITSPASNTVNVPVIQLTGYSPEKLASISYDLSNAAGEVTNQQVLVLDQNYDTTTSEYTTNTFQAFDISLTNGVNTITLHAADLAGNVATLVTNFTLDYSNKPAPGVQIYWPQDGTLICSSNYTWRGHVDDPTATVTAQVVDSSGDTNIFNGIVERNGNFWVENLPLGGGTNWLTLTVADAAGNVTNASIMVFPGSVALTITMPSSDQLWNQGLTVDGTISDPGDYTVWVNGNKANYTEAWAGRRPMCICRKAARR